jgi:hypothetical protein
MKLIYCRERHIGGHRRVERLNRLDVQSRHAGIKARNSGNEKREEKPRLADSLLATASKICRSASKNSPGWPSARKF